MTSDGKAKRMNTTMKTLSVIAALLLMIAAAAALAGPTTPGDLTAGQSDDGDDDDDDSSGDEEDWTGYEVVDPGYGGAAVEPAAEEPAEAAESEDGDYNYGSLPGEATPNQDKVIGRRSLNKVPPYRLVERSLQYQERRLGVQFFRNKKGMYAPYATRAWDSFSIADRDGECLYDVNVRGVMNYRYLEGKRELLLDLSVTPGPCGLTYPNAHVEATDRISTMEGAVVSPNLIDRLDSNGMCSDMKFVQDVLQFPYKIEIIGDDVLRSVARVGTEVGSPMRAAFGDVVSFSPYPEERAIGIYVGYGLVVYNSCFGAKAHKMVAGRQYDIFRLVTGFSATRYRIHDRKFLQRYLGEVQ